jgi:hypothetical protein
MNTNGNHTNSNSQPTAGPLTGIRVLDVSTVYAAPITAMLLGDYGAGVLKVEHPRGDPARTHGHNKDRHGLWWKVISRAAGLEPPSTVCTRDSTATRGCATKPSSPARSDSSASPRSTRAHRLLELAGRLPTGPWPVEPSGNRLR